DIEIVKNRIPYVRVLGFTKDGQSYLKSLKEKEVEILTTLKNIQRILSVEDLKFLEMNEIASKIYSIVNEYEEKKIPIMIR
ncbi:MAG: nucleotidyltransferase family protein, partial [Cetobacterium sp.]